MMNMMIAPTREIKEESLLTGEEMFDLGDIGPAELVKGIIKRQMPTGNLHGRIESLLTFFLFAFIRRHNLGHVLTGEVGLYTGRNPDTVRGFDLAYISHERYAQVQSAGYLEVAPELVVEILSPTDRWSDMQVKLAEYFAVGVQVVWIVDPQLAQIHVFTALDNVQLFKGEDVLEGSPLLPGFQLPLSELFTV